MVGRLFPVEAINYYVRKYLQSKTPNTFVNNVFIAMAAGISSTALIYPSEILIILMNNQIQGKISVNSAINTMIRDYGLTYFYKGMTTLLGTVALYRAIYNGIYDTYRSKVNTIRGKAVVAYFSTIFAEYVAYPIEIVRRRRVLVNSKESFMQYAMKIW
jgi:hypothetical protein